MHEEACAWHSRRRSRPSKKAAALSDKDATIQRLREQVDDKMNQIDEKIGVLVTGGVLLADGAQA